jgi:ribosomal protein S7
LVQLAIINTTSAFKINEQVMKKGKRKSKKVTPSFIVKDSLRIMTALKFIRNTVQRNKSSTSLYKDLANEILASFSSKSQSIEQKTKLQTQILVNKRYLSKFKW